ncbi:hypothetical protein BDZ91DRAFT_711431, partial [Kalaharituber pfeilii]
MVPLALPYLFQWQTFHDGSPTSVLVPSNFAYSFSNTGQSAILGGKSSEAQKVTYNVTGRIKFTCWLCNPTGISYTLRIATRFSQPTRTTPFPSHSVESPAEASYNSGMKIRARHAKISVMKFTIEKLLELSMSELFILCDECTNEVKNFKSGI